VGALARALRLASMCSYMMCVFGFLVCFVD
jgi:hypothetical protein